MTDKLTGLPTHRDDLRGALLRVPSRAVLVDIDGLIWVNDQFGHAEGDRVLALVATFLRELRADSPGTVFRVGGDEFLVLLPGFGVAETLRIAALIVSGVRALKIPFRRVDRPERTVLEVNVVVVEVTDAFANGAFSDRGFGGSARELVQNEVYREKVRVGSDAGVVLDLSNASW